MQWKITVKPATEEKVKWDWTAEAEDNETVRVGRENTQQEASNAARAMVDDIEQSRQIIRDATTVELYGTPDPVTEPPEEGGEEV